MKTVWRYYLLIPILIPVLCSCTEGPEGLPGPERLTGDGEGRVTVLDEFSISSMDPRGVAIKAIGYDHEITATSDPDGEYQLTGMQTGHYRVEYEKQGFGKYVLAYRFLGGEMPEVLRDVDLVQLSTTVVEEFNLWIEPGTIICEGIISPPSTEGAPRKIILYLDQNEAVSNTSFKNFYPLTDNHIDSDLFHYEIPLYMGDFPAGRTTYMVAYGISGSSWDGGSSYYDEFQEMYIINVNPANSKRASIYVP